MKDKKIIGTLLFVLFIVSTIICANQLLISKSSTTTKSKPIYYSITIEYKNPIIYSKLNNISQINSTHILKLCKQSLNNYTNEDTTIRILDRLYQTIDIEQYKIIINHSCFLRDTYIDDISDCDDYSFKVLGIFSSGNLSGLPVGILIWSIPPHAEPFFIDNQDTIWIILSKNQICKVSELDRTTLNMLLI